MDKLIKAGRLILLSWFGSNSLSTIFYGDIRPVFFTGHPGHHGYMVFSIWAYLSGTAIIVTCVLILLGNKIKDPISLLRAEFFLVLFLVFHAPFLLFVNQNLPYHLGLWTDPHKRPCFIRRRLLLFAGSFHETKPEGEKESFLINLLEKLIPLGILIFFVLP
jgi:hypothetical protein